MELNQHFTFYLESLRTAEKAIIEEKGKALKDIVGFTFEQHRK